MRVLKSFGLGYFCSLASRAVLYKLFAKLPRRPLDRHYSVQQACKTHGVEMKRVRSVNSDDTCNMLKEWGVDLLVSISCPQLFRKKLFELAPHGCLNLHCSPLPDYRGLYPAFWMLKHEEEQVAATLFFVNETIDGGDILIQRPFNVEPKHTLHTFLKKSKRVGSTIILEGIEQVRSGNVKTTPLDVHAGRYFSWPTREDVREFRTKRRLR